MPSLTLIAALSSLVTAVFCTMDHNWGAAAGWYAAAFWAFKADRHEKLIRETANDLRDMCAMLEVDPQ